MSEPAKRRPATWGAALIDATFTYAKGFVALVLLNSVLMGLAVLLSIDWLPLLAITINVIAVVMSFMVFPASVWQRLVDARDQERLAQLEEARAHLGARELDIRIDPKERLEHTLADSSGSLLAALFVELCLIAPFALNTSSFFDAGRLDVPWLIFAMFVTLSLPAYVALSLFRSVSDENSIHAEKARAERAYRIMTSGKDREELTGTLSLDTGRDDERGHLSVSAEAGSLAMESETILELENRENERDVRYLDEYMTHEQGTT